MRQAALSSLFGALALCLFAGCASLPPSQLESALYANAEQTGIRWGVAVSDMDGTPLIAMRAEDRFTPASNTKIATSMAGFKLLQQLEAPLLAPGLTVHLEAAGEGEAQTLVLVGGGDAMIGDGPDCAAHCLADLANQIAAAGVTQVGDIVGDDTLFPDERWAPGWSQEDLQYTFGTAVSALSVNDNELLIYASPGPDIGAPARLTWREGDDLLTVLNETVTIAAGGERVIVAERLPGASTVRFYGEIPLDNGPSRYRLGVLDPALFAARRLKRHLLARGIEVTGEATVRHRPLTLADFPEEGVVMAFTTGAQTPRARPIARLAPTPLRESLQRVSRDSQNLHAELVLRRLGLIMGTGSRAHGLAMVEALWAEAGVPETGYAVYDGSGMSIYNRITPSGMVRLLAFAAKQDWFEVWKATLPVAGKSGTLARRLQGTALEGKVFAKTGTLNGVNALSGYMIARSGRELIFSIIANDRPALTRSALAERDAALLAIAEAY